jgi:hypothetical protein
MYSLALLVRRQALLAQQLQQGKRGDFRLTVNLALLDSVSSVSAHLSGWSIWMDGILSCLPILPPTPLHVTPASSIARRNAGQYLPFLW